MRLWLQVLSATAGPGGAQRRGAERSQALPLLGTLVAPVEMDFIFSFVGMLDK